MKIYKFGGTSIGSANRMKDAAKLITNTERKIVVVSAISGTTNTLLKIAEHLYSKKNYDAELLINELENKYRLIADGLFDNSKFLCEGKELIDLNINNIKSLAQNAFTIHEEKAIRSEEHTSELQSHSFISYAVFCLKKKTNNKK